MKLAHPMLNQPIEWENISVNSFVIENSIMYRNFIKELYEQSKGLGGNFILSDNLSIKDISKYVEIIPDILMIESSTNKKIITGIVKELTDIAINEKHVELQNLYSKINETISSLIFESNGDFVFDDINDISQILKLYNIRPDDETLSLPEKILLYMGLCEKYLGKKLFVFLNLNSYFTFEEKEKLIKDFAYRKSNVLLVERYDYKSSNLETKRIIDADLCEI